MQNLKKILCYRHLRILDLNEFYIQLRRECDTGQSVYAKS